METLLTMTVIVAMAAALLSVVMWSVRNGISPMPTSGKVRKIILDASLKASQGTIFELGSGWGTLLLPLAKGHPRCRVIGYETSPIPYYVSKVRGMISGSDNLKVVRSDFFHEPLHEAALIVCYLYPGAMKMLKQKFDEELKPGTLVISNTFSIPGWEPLEVHVADDMYRTKVYVYRTWRYCINHH